MANVIWDLNSGNTYEGMPPPAVPADSETRFKTLRTRYVALPTKVVEWTPDPMCFTRGTGRSSEMKKGTGLLNREFQEKLTEITGDLAISTDLLSLSHNSVRRWAQVSVAFNYIMSIALTRVHKEAQVDQNAKEWLEKGQKFCCHLGKLDLNVPKSIQLARGAGLGMLESLIKSETPGRWFPDMIGNAIESANDTNPAMLKALDVGLDAFYHECSLIVMGCFQADTTKTRIKGFPQRRIVLCPYPTWFGLSRVLCFNLPAKTLEAYPGPEEGAHIQATIKKWGRFFTHAQEVDGLFNNLVVSEKVNLPYPNLFSHLGLLTPEEVTQVTAVKIQLTEPEPCPEQSPGSDPTVEPTELPETVPETSLKADLPIGWDMDPNMDPAMWLEVMAEMHPDMNTDEEIGGRTHGETWS